jgi:photosystem II stability/assembly factor-like uncharacterized protein
MNHLISFVLLFIIASSAFAQQWEQTNGVGGNGALSIAINPSGDVFVVSNALHRSTDKGVTWTRIFPQMTAKAIQKVGIQPSGRIIVSVSSPYLNTSINGLYASDDNGNSWKQLNVKATSFYRGASGSLFAISLQNDTIYKSIDNGDSWQELNTIGITNKPFYCATQDNAGVMFVCSKYLYRSTDNGTSWGKVINGIDPDVTTILMAPDGTLYAFGFTTNGLYHSVDNGRTWEVLSSSSKYILSVAFYEKIIFALSLYYEGSITMSTDNGLTWKTLPMGNLSQTGTGACAAESNGKFLVTLNDHLCRFDTIDISNVALVSVPNGNVTAIATTNDEHIIASNFNTIVNIWRSSDEGQNWLYLTEIPFVNKSQVPFIQTDSSNSILIPEAGNVYGSIDGGFSWNTLNQKPLTDGSLTCLAVDAENSIFTCSSSEGMFRSSDHGKTWDQLNSGITSQQLFCICTTPNRNIYTGGSSCIYKSTNKGLTWTQVLTINSKYNNYFPPVKSISVSNLGPIYASVSFLGLWKSVDDGQNWVSDSSALPTKTINILFSTPDGKTFAGTDSGVFVNDNKPGSEWTPFNNGLTAMNVQTLCIDNKGYLYAGTDVSGIFKTKATFGTTTRGVTTNSSTTTFSLSTPFPNPASTSTTIPFSISGHANVRLDVTDALGRIVAIVTDGVYEAGYHTVVFETRNLSPGVYYIRLRSGGKSEIRPIVKAE